MTTLAARFIRRGRDARYGRAVLVGLMLLGAGTTAPSAAPVRETDSALVARAHAIHERVPTIDTHDDIPLDFATEDVDPAEHGTQRGCPNPLRVLREVERVAAGSR